NISDSFVDEEQLSIPLEHLLSAEKLETDVIDQLLNEFDQNEPYRVCRRVNILRDYPDDKIKIYP
ncbi:hypothetical protein QCF01_18565, partial [Staphylococcus aureus]|nr:hypothetical protein [Staphylococcus aureus]